MLKDFWDKENLLVKTCAFLTGMSALFLNIQFPQNNDMAKKALENVQVFWLVVLGVALSVLFAKLTALVFKKEQEIGNRYDRVSFGLVSLLVAVTFIWVILNFFQYVTYLYTDRFNELFGFLLPLMVIVFLFTLLISTVKYKEKFSVFSIVVIDSFAIAALAEMSLLFIQFGIWKYASYFSVYFVFPALFLLFCFLFSVANYYGKYKAG